MSLCERWTSTTVSTVVTSVQNKARWSLDLACLDSRTVQGKVAVLSTPRTAWSTFFGHLGQMWHNLTKFNISFGVGSQSRLKNWKRDRCNQRHISIEWHQTNSAILLGPDRFVGKILWISVLHTLLLKPFCYCHRHVSVWQLPHHPFFLSKRLLFWMWTLNSSQTKKHFLVWHQNCHPQVRHHSMGRNPHPLNPQMVWPNDLSKEGLGQPLLVHHHRETMDFVSHVSLWKGKIDKLPHHPHLQRVVWKPVLALKLWFLLLPRLKWPLQAPQQRASVEEASAWNQRHHGRKQNLMVLVFFHMVHHRKVASDAWA